MVAGKLNDYFCLIQDRITRSETERSGQEWSKQYYMPTSSDRFSLAFTHAYSLLEGPAHLQADRAFPILCSRPPPDKSFHR